MKNCVLCYFRVLQTWIDGSYFNFLSTAVGLNNGISSSTGDYSILRLSIEAPYIVKLTYTTCVAECLKKNSRKPNELSIEGGFLELVGKVEIGFGKVNYELGALTAKLHGFGDKKRLV